MAYKHQIYSLKRKLQKLLQRFGKHSYLFMHYNLRNIYCTINSIINQHWGFNHSFFKDILAPIYTSINFTANISYWFYMKDYNYLGNLNWQPSNWMHSLFWSVVLCHIFIPAEEKLIKKSTVDLRYAICTQCLLLIIKTKEVSLPVYQTVIRFKGRIKRRHWKCQNQLSYCAVRNIFSIISYHSIPSFKDILKFALSTFFFALLH